MGDSASPPKSTVSGEKPSTKFGIAGPSAADWNHRYHGCRQVNAIEGSPLVVAFGRGRKCRGAPRFPRQMCADASLSAKESWLSLRRAPMYRSWRERLNWNLWHSSARIGSVSVVATRSIAPGSAIGSVRAVRPLLHGGPARSNLVASCADHAKGAFNCAGASPSIHLCGRSRYRSHQLGSPLRGSECTSQGSQLWLPLERPVCARPCSSISTRRLARIERQSLRFHRSKEPSTWNVRSRIERKDWETASAARIQPTTL